MSLVMINMMLRKLFAVMMVALSCLSATAQGMGMIKKPWNPKDFFEGQQLVIAEGIAKNDLSALRATYDLDLLSREGKKELTLMWFASDNFRPNFEATRILVEKGVDPSTQILRPFGPMLHYSLKQKDLRYLTALLDGGLSVDYKYQKRPLIMLAAGPHGSLEHVKLLVERGADIHLKDRLGNNALNESLSIRPEIAIYLIEQGADIHNVNYNGVTAARQVELRLNRLTPGTDHYNLFKKVQNMLIERGIKFPAPSLEEMKEWRRSQGLYVIGDD